MQEESLIKPLNCDRIHRLMLHIWLHVVYETWVTILLSSARRRNFGQHRRSYSWVLGSTNRPGLHVCLRQGGWTSMLLRSCRGARLSDGSRKRRYPPTPRGPVAPLNSSTPCTPFPSRCWATDRSQSPPRRVGPARTLRFVCVPSCCQFKIIPLQISRSCSPTQ